MTEALGVAFAFVVIIVLVTRKVHMGSAMLAGASIIALASRYSAARLLNVTSSAFTSYTTWELALSVVFISLIGNCMKKTGRLDSMVNSLRDMVRSNRAAIMLTPALIGTMPVLGGAALSAPMVDALGDKMSLDPETKSAANLVFRHACFLVFPFMPGLILASRLWELDLYRLVLMNMPAALAAIITAYFTLLGGSKNPDSERFAPFRDAARSFVSSAAPILVALATFGALSTTLPLSLGMGAAVALIQARKQVSTRSALGFVDWWTSLSMLAIMIFRGMVQEAQAVGSLIGALIDSGVSKSLLFFLIPLLLGFITGSVSVTVAVSFPILIPFAKSAPATYAMLAYSASFISYMTSPIHLCQLLTCQYFGVRPWKVFLKYLPSLLALVAAVVIVAAVTL
ncbi:MAG: DUF401 family protein [Bacillota bacterium]